MLATNFTVIKITFCLIVGILIGYHTNISVQNAFYISFFSLVLILISYLYNKTNSNKTPWFGIVTLLTFLCIGVLTTVLHNHKNNKNHYTNIIDTGTNNSYNMTFKVRQVLKPGNYYDKYIVDFISIESSKVVGKSLLNVKKDTTSLHLKVDDIVYTKTEIKDLIEPLNPHQFNYKNYLRKQHIYNQLFVNGNQILKLRREKHTVLGFAAKLRETINVKLKAYNFEADELAIINALILGQRQDISREIYGSYTQAGAIHILAVSGLHIGIILLILNFLFKPIESIKYGILLKTILILLFLWSFTIVAGLSASVTRAVTMFSLVAIGMNLKRPTNIYNTLAISMFILLLIKPTFLFDVGFQLSYLAVFSIVWIQPLLYKIWSPKQLIIDKFWQIFTVTIAAQFGIVPLSLYYFHQFPGLFFISNLVIIPVLGLILGLGLLVILLALLNVLPTFLASIFGYIIGLMNDFVSFIGNQEAFLFKNIPFGILLVATSYFLIVSAVQLYNKKTYKRTVLMLISIIFFISAFIYNKYDVASNEFIIFHKSRLSVIGLKHERSLTIHHNLDSTTLSNDKLLTNYRIGSWTKTLITDSIQPVYKINDKLILVVDSLGIYRTSFKPNYVLLRNSPKINLDRLIQDINPEMIIADGSNYKSYQERWHETCLKKELPFHQTSKKGAFLIKF